MHSMTGYGRARAESAGREMTVELKSVNHRYLDVNLRLPRGLLFLEDPIRKALAARLNRGHVDVFLTYRNTRADAREVAVDLPLLDAYLTALDQIARRSGIPDDRSLMQVAQMGEVLTVTERDEDQSAVTVLCMQALGGALDALGAMRAAEGLSLREDIAERLRHLLALADRIASRAPKVVGDYRQRLEARLGELLASPPDPQRLAQEVALMADRAAIDEELVRLKSHVDQCLAAIAAKEPVGRKLDFLVQELNREVNTIGSKAQDLEISGMVVDAKAEIEKIREQVQNIE